MWRMTMTVAAVAAVLVLGHFASAPGRLRQEQKCEAPKEWFPHDKTPEPTFGAVNDVCGFHQWAWQTFLWLTQKDGDQIRLLGLPSGDDLFMPGKAPARFATVSKRKKGAKKSTLMLHPRVRKAATATHFGDLQQAISRGILVDQNGHPVYYATHVNKDFFEFVRKNKLYLRSGYDAFPKDGNFPTKCLELKSSWRIVEEGEKTDGLITAKAVISQLACSDGNKVECHGGTIVQDPLLTDEKTVALVGLHVVGAIKDHPEFVWATFEHVNNAPSLPDGQDPTSDKPVSNKGFTFYKANIKAKDCNALDPDAVKLDVQKQKLSPVTQIFRRFEFGKADAQNVKAVTQLNKSVHGQLDNKSPLQNYALVGSVWFKPSEKLTPGLAGNTILNKTTGSVELSNSTMETFTQGPFLTKRGCFACHDTGPIGGLPAKNVNLSHLLVNGVTQREAVKHTFKAMLTAKHPAKLSSFDDVRKLLNDFVKTNNVPIKFSPHKDFWNTLDYDKFTGGDVPNVADDDGKPLKILVRKDSDKSNLIQALRGTKGTIFDPDTGSIGRMPPSGPFMTDDQIALLADWIKRDCPK